MIHTLLFFYAQSDLYIKINTPDLHSFRIIFLLDKSRF